MKKLLALILAMALACSLCVPALAAEEGESTLTLVVNGVASDAAVTAGEGVTYADAAQLRDILGSKAAAPTYEGPVPIREAAENAGWEVEWYDGGWEGLDRQVCLWNKEAFAAEVKPQLEGFQTLYDAAMDRSREAIFTETPQRAVENLTVTFKRFDTLDGDKTYNLKLRAETVYEKGVLDCTVTFDVSQLLGMFPAAGLETMAQEAGLSLSDFKALFSAGKMEFIIDCNVGGLAYNIPLLGLIDEDLAGWQTSYTSLYDYSQENADFAGSLYARMRDYASQWGGVAGREYVDDSLETIGVFFSPDSVKTSGSAVTWTAETGKVNAALSKLGGDGDKVFSLFKKCDVTMTFDAQGETDLTLAFRPDTDGIAEAAMATGNDMDMPYALGYSLLGRLLGGLDMELTATAHGDQAKSAGTLTLHIKNFGVFDVSAQSTTKSAAQGPRQLAEVERQWVEPAAGSTVTSAR